MNMVSYSAKFYEQKYKINSDLKKSRVNKNVSINYNVLRYTK